MELLRQVVFYIYVVATAAAMVSILMDRRQPAKTIAWLLVLMFLPVIGFILYFFFGQNTRKERIISQHSLDLLSRRKVYAFANQRELLLPDDNKSLVQLFINQGLAVPLRGIVSDVYTDGYRFFPALLAAIASARHHIHLTTYIIEDDPLGNLVADALIARAQEGVEVRLIYDDVGCWKVGNRFFERLKHGGVDVEAFMPVRFPAFTSKVNYRNHRKICIVDGTVGFIGGMNIAMRYRRWRDTHMRIEGSAVCAMQCAFLIDWYFVTRTLITGEEYYRTTRITSTPAPTSTSASTPTADLSLMQLVTSSPTSQWPEIEQGYVRILSSARHYVYMETPYFLPTEPILFALRAAAISGVDVRLMLPLHGDAKLVEWASRSYVVQTVEAGVKVYLYKPTFNHSKLLVCDDALAVCGSANIDFRSFENNFEANVFVYDRPVALRMKEVFLDDLRQCILLDDITNLEHRPFTQRLWESLVRLLAPLL